MKVLIYPADESGCGYLRLIWPARYLAEEGYDISIVSVQDTKPTVSLDGSGNVIAMKLPDNDIDVVVFQRTTHRLFGKIAKYLRSQGIAVVIDLDDDLSRIDPSHDGFIALHPRNEGKKDNQGREYQHSWQNVIDSCKNASLVTVSTSGLLNTYAPHGNGMILRNYLPDHYYDVSHEDSDNISWPAFIQTHPKDPYVMGPAISRIVREGGTFTIVGDPTGAGKAFALDDDPDGTGPIEFDKWPNAIAKIGIGIAPLDDTKFNASKSWLKPLELSAVGVPWVASPRAEYLALHDLGCGVVASRPKDWYRALKTLRQSPARRLELSQAGKSVAETMRLRRNAWRYMEAWQHAYDSEHATFRV